MPETKNTAAKIEGCINFLYPLISNCLALIPPYFSLKQYLQS